MEQQERAHVLDALASASASPLFPGDFKPNLVIHALKKGRQAAALAV